METSLSFVVNELHLTKKPHEYEEGKPVTVFSLKETCIPSLLKSQNFKL